MGKKLLLADDSITIQKVIELTFSDEDFEVVTVSNGRLAIERVQEVRPDIVLCDIIMPGIDGAGIYDALQRRWPHLLGRLVFISGYADALDDHSPLYAEVAPPLLHHSECYKVLGEWYLKNLFGNLHARQDWELFSPIAIGSRVRTRSTIVERYSKRGRDYVVNETDLMDAASGRLLVRGRTHQIRAMATSVFESRGIREEGGTAGVGAGAGAIVGGIIGGLKGAIRLTFLGVGELLGDFFHNLRTQLGKNAINYVCNGPRIRGA